MSAQMSGYVSPIPRECCYLTKHKDEFDVFMDSINRRTSLKMMVRVLRSDRGSSAHVIVD